MGKIRHNLNLLITFLASGLWHGANWTFVVWGGCHGLAQIVENTFSHRKKNYNIVLKVFGILKTFAFCSFAWIFFVSGNLADAAWVISHLFVGIADPLSYFRKGFTDIGLGMDSLVFLVIWMSILVIYDGYSLKLDVIDKIGEKGIFVRWTAYVIMVLIILFFSEKGVAAEFIYFQF